MGKPFAVPSANAEFELKNVPHHASSVLVTSTHYGALPMIERRRRADTLACQMLSSGNFISDVNLESVLSTWGFAKNTKRRNVTPADSEYVFSECFGLVYDRTGRWMLSAVARLFPSVAMLFNRWFTDRLAQLGHRAFDAPLSQWRWSAITVNRGYVATRHCDMNNYGASAIRSIANAKDRLLYWPEESRKTIGDCEMDDAVELAISSRKKVFAFDGTCPHEVKQYHGDVASRMSIIFFQSSRGWRADDATTARLRELGFVPATSAEDAESFADRFKTFSAGRNWNSWPVESS